jgi:hypothetical protein
MEIRHTADYRQAAPSERQVRRVVLTAERFMAAIREVFQHGQGSSF